MKSLTIPSTKKLKHHSEQVEVHFRARTRVLVRCTMYDVRCTMYSDGLGLEIAPLSSIIMVDPILIVHAT